MPQVAIPNTTRIVALQSMAGEQAVNVWHVRDAVEGTPPVISATIEAFRIFYVGSGSTAGTRGLAAQFGTDWRLEGISYQRIHGVPYPDPAMTSIGTAGNDPASLLPTQTALCLSLRTGVASRRARGRIFLCGFTEAQALDDAAGVPRPTTTVTTALQNALTDLDDNLNAAAGQLAVASELDQVSRSVTAVRVANRWATQRRRTKDFPTTALTTVSFLEA